LASSNSFEPKACKECLVKAACTKNMPQGTLCKEAHEELRKLIFSFKDK